MKVVFLDVDGVLNSEQWFQQRPTPKRFTVDPKCVARVRKLCEVTDAKVVLSSSWRVRMKVRQLVDLLSRSGLPREVMVGVTPHLLPHELPGTMEEAPRGMEILEWLTTERYRENLRGGRVEKFVIIDDKSDMFGLEKHLVQTNKEIGISDRDVEVAISHLT